MTFYAAGAARTSNTRLARQAQYAADGFIVEIHGRIGRALEMTFHLFSPTFFFDLGR